MIEIRIPGELRGKGRPRFSARGGFARAFTDPKTANAEAWVKACAVQAFTGAPIVGPVSVQLEIGVAVPKSWPKKRRADALAGAIWPTTKPDLDNQIKLIGDALNGIVWQDDAQIVRAVVSRRYVETPAAVLTVAEV
jgi:Holliday junction resolvase RusA-like endonuclease